MGDLDTLRALGDELGLTGVDATLAGNAYAKEVRQDEADAQELGIRGVPFFVLDRRLGVSGAQSADVLLRAMEESWKGLPEETPEGSQCGPDGCG